MQSEIVQFNGQDIMAEFDTYYAEDYRAYGQLYPAMAQDLRFYLGDQWYQEEITAFKEEGRKQFTINKTKAKIDWINGYAIQNRLSPLILPIQGGSEEAANQMTKVALYVLDKNGGYRQQDETFGAGNKTGWSILNTYLDYTDDPVNGDIHFGRDPYSGFIPSAYFSKLDLSDCDHVMKRKYITPQVAATLLPGQEDEVMSLARDGWERDNKFTWMVFQKVPTGQRMMAYNEFYHMKYAPQKVILNKMTMQYVDWDGDKELMQYLKSQAEQYGHDLELISRHKRYIEKHVILNNNYMRTEINPYGLDKYPFAMYAPVFEPESEEFTFKVQSLVRQLIDPARERNRRRSQLIDVVESQLNAGWIEEDGAVKNPKMLYQSGQGRRIVLNKDFKIDSIQKIAPAMIPASYFQEIDMTDRDEMEILGMNPTSFGHVETKQVSALVELQRQKAGMMALEDVFDRFACFKKQIAENIVKISQNWSKSKIKAILGEEPVDEYFDKDLTKYNITVAEGMHTPTQRYLFFRQVLELKEMGEPIPPGLLTKIAPIQGKSEFMKEVEQFSKQQMQQQQQGLQQEQQQQQMLGQSVQAKSIADLALAKERQARAIADLGLEEERNAQAIKNREEAAFNHIRTLQEMEKLEVENAMLKDKRLTDLVNFAQLYQDKLRSEQDELAEKQKADAQGVL